MKKVLAAVLTAIIILSLTSCGSMPDIQDITDYVNDISDKYSGTGKDITSGSNDIPKPDSKFDSDLNTSDNNDTCNDNSNSVQDRTFTLGDTAVYKDWLSVTMVDIQDNPNQAVVEYYFDEGTILIDVIFEVENNGKEDYYVSASNFSAYVDSYFAENYGSLHGDLAPGKKLKGSVTLAVPEDWQELEIQYEIDYSLEDKIIFVYTRDN